MMLCERWDKEFGSLIPLAETLTPYAVRPRYDTDFWPSLDEAQQARTAALIRSFVYARMPSSLRP
jgi:hypothetical protein